MQNEMKKLNSAKREHAKLLRNQQQSEKQLKMMQNDLKEMKKLKVSSRSFLPGYCLLHVHHYNSDVLTRFLWNAESCIAMLLRFLSNVH